MSEDREYETRREKKHRRQQRKRKAEKETSIREVTRVCRDHFDAIQEFAPTVHRVSPPFGKRGDDATYKNHNHHPRAGYCPNPSPNLIPCPDGGPSPTAASSALPACAPSPPPLSFPLRFPLARDTRRFLLPTRLPHPDHCQGRLSSLLASCPLTSPQNVISIGYVDVL